MTLHQLKAFVTVADHGSITEAAKTLELRQPSVTLLIQNLERELKVKLFERLGNKIRLTGTGEKVLQHTEEILAEVDRITEEINEIKGLGSGKIKVGGSGLAGASFLLLAVQMFKEKYPGIEVQLNIEKSAMLEKMLLEGQIDIAIQGNSRSPLLVMVPYYEEEIVAIAPPSHPLTKKTSVSFELLADQPIVINRKGTFTRDLVERKFAERELTIKPALEVNIQYASRDAIRRAVANGLGIGFSPKYLIMDHVKAGRLKILKVPQLNLKRTLYITVHKNRQRSPLVKAFMSFLKNFKKQL